MPGLKPKHPRKPHRTTIERPRLVLPRMRRPIQTWEDLMDHIATHSEEIWERIYKSKQRMEQGIF
jgi:hypothetical protein